MYFLSSVPMFKDPNTERAHQTYLAQNQETADEERDELNAEWETFGLYLDDLDHQIHRPDDDYADLPKGSEHFPNFTS